MCVCLATTMTGQKESVYSMVMNDAGTVLICGSTEKVGHVLPLVDYLAHYS